MPWKHQFIQLLGRRGGIMQVEIAKKWLLLFNQKIQDNKDYLSELDTPIGDGDHGGNMSRGMAAVVADIADKDYGSTAELLQAVAMQLLSKVGGASGPLYGSAFMGMARAEQDSGSLSALVRAGLEMIKKRGKAESGEKTMVDVWEPVLKDLETKALTLERIDDYVQATAPLKATKGRASYVGDRSIGHLDPGAFSSGLLFKALIEAEE